MQAKVVGWVTRLHLPPGKTGELSLRGPAIMKESEMRKQERFQWHLW
ncbi:hypothetical protein Hanom_Chr09g00804941 [Helianthus anomalus]